MRAVRRILVALALAGLAVIACAPGMLDAQDDESMTFARDTLVVRTAAGEHAFDVELALTPAQRGRGLMHRDRVEPDQGMLFVFEEPREAAFWMKNTRIPLDMIFIDEAGRIIRIARMTTPYSEAPVPSGGIVRGVLEIAGGRAVELGIAVGDRVIHPSFRSGS